MKGTSLLRSFYYLLLLTLPTFAQSGGGCNGGEIISILTPLIGALTERIITMAVKLDALTEVVQRVDLTTRTRLAEFLEKYDALRKENEQLKLQLTDQLKVDEQVQSVIDGQVRALENIITGLNNFGGSL